MTGTSITEKTGASDTLLLSGVFEHTMFRLIAKTALPLKPITSRPVPICVDGNEKFTSHQIAGGDCE